MNFIQKIIIMFLIRIKRSYAYLIMQVIIEEQKLKTKTPSPRLHPFQDGNGRIGRIIAFKECLKNNKAPFIILDKEKLFYYRGLSQYQTNKEKGYLVDNCLSAQDKYKNTIKDFLSN